MKKVARRLARYAAKEQAGLLIVLAAISTGTAVGWSTGQAGLDSRVLAAVLPVIITSIAGGAGAVVLKIMNGQKDGTTPPPQGNRKVVVIAALVVTTFSITYMAGVQIGRIMNEQATLANEQRIAMELVERQYKYLTRCMGQLKRLNAVRRATNEKSEGKSALEPLTINQVCIALPDGTWDEGPLVALADDKGLVALLSEETEEGHYKTLEQCSHDQARLNRTRTEELKVRIGWVCPALAQP